MATEQEKLHNIFDRVVEFMLAGPHRGVNSFCLVGPVPDEPTWYSIFVALFPGGPDKRDGSFMVLSTNPGEKENPSYQHRRIIELALPERIRSLNMGDIKDLQAIGESQALLQGWPLLALAFGKTERGGQDVAILLSVVGYSPSTALRLLQQRSAQRLFGQ